MSICASVAISIIMSLVLTCDLILVPKDSKIIIRSVIYAATVSVPALANAGGLQNYQVINTFYVILLVFIVLSFVWAYFADFKKLIKCVEEQNLNGLEYTFADYLLSGRKNFRDKIEKNVFNGENFKKIQNDIKQTSIFNKKMASFISVAYLTMNDSAGYHDYCKNILCNFATIFFGTSNSRFTLRKLSTDKKQMVADVCSEETVSPSPIPIRGKSLIKLSKEKDEPIIYSRNKKYHYDTKGSILRNDYDDYVSYCLIKTPDKKLPEYSVCLEVKGHEAKTKLKNIVDSNIFTILCKAMECKIENENHSTKNNTSPSGDQNVH